ncbi:CpsD/CapB family tyrosine-protein kinase [Priestia megaterium]|uniref:CpsD/CapB family tyrosine-protein kinase n=1 Tax=Priestia megaterium TaxID=1404 RepID=UPI0013E3A9E2|nr:CpsD/CapB family tyrosine-protein kinase [Priestia megaterium]MED4141586.1 CpsD/CapB family tyrosine-protein kinase [Priestia megaterium]MED4169235.1 CpsD/CapB family tyrosine-protein kinase [Priestia megaterium]MED4198949.1 CpsD/CapB family tyrosine-protein kinase [Priestia megaterium]
MAANKRSQGAALKKQTLVTYSNPNSVISDQFRTIRANLHFLTKENTSKLFLITSPKEGEGKSTMAANLAVSMAQQKDKVLLIDANLREPVIHDIFNIQNTGGLTGVLENEVTFEEAVYQTRIENLDILTSGAALSNFVELLGNQKMKNLLTTLSACYDTILIDGPSVLTSPETRVLSTYSEGVILILKRGKTEIEKIEEAKRVLDIAEAKLVGVVMNEK